MAVDTTSQHSRRSLLAGAIGSIVAILAQALGRPPTTKGAVEYVKLGGTNTTDGSTSISSSNPQASTWKNLGSGHGFLSRERVKLRAEGCEQLGHWRLRFQ